ncbi:MAG: hypothetical protein COB04_11570 [Gammaproteobacteria bacterium]|nr:MAG: hypothetical protein COB04_11570 [Gammaproteobacteria bacterium]
MHQELKTSSFTRLNLASLPQRQLLAALLLIVLVFQTTPTIAANTLTAAKPEQTSETPSKTTILPFEAHYSAKWNKVSLRGLAVRKLIINEANQQEFSFNAKTLAAKVQESSHFNWHRCSPVPSAYHYERKGFLKKKKTLQQTFNWDDQQVTSNTSKYSTTFDLPMQSTDKLSYQLAIRCDLKQGNTDLNYQVVDKSRLKQYSFEIVNEEILETPLGTLNAIKVKRVREANQRQTFLWFAKELDYLLVKLEQYDTGGNHYVINIKSLQNSHATAKQ